MSALTVQEETHIRTALRFLHTRCGTWILVAAAIRGVKAKAIAQMAQGHRPASPAVAVRIARLAKVTVDDVLTGRFPQAGACPHCGQPVPAREPAQEIGSVS
jgi:hypothetical protein